MEGIDINNYEILENEDNDGYIKDKNNIYYNEKKIENADISSFEIMKYNYSKDKNFDFPNKNVGVIHEYGLSLLNPPAPVKWKTEKIFE